MRKTGQTNYVKYGELSRIKGVTTIIRADVAGKQDRLTESQQAAVDSGITAAKVQVYDSVASLAHSHFNKTTVLDKLRWDAQNNAIYIGDADHPINFCAFGAITAGGVGSGGNGGQGGGISTIYLGSTRYDAAAGSTAIVIPTTGADSVKVPLGITSLESRVTVLENRPQGGVTSLGGKSGEITVRGGQTANGSVNLTMSGTQLQASIVGLGSLAFKSSLVASDIPSLTISKITGLQTALDAKESTTHAAATYQPLATAINTGNIASQSVARAHGLTSVHITASFDLNTALSGGGVTGNYGSTNYWVNGPSGMGYGSVAQIQASTDRGDQLALQLAWDIEHNSTSSTKRLWFRSSNNLGWQADWKEIYHSGNLTSLSQLGQDAGHRLVTDAQITLWTKIANLFDTDSNGNVYVRNEKGFYSYSFIATGGIGSGGSGSTGALYTCVDVTAYNNSKVGRDSTHPAQSGDLLAYDGNKWHAVVAPATGVTSLGGATGAITVRGGQTANGSVNLSMSGTQLQASIVGLGALAYQSSVAAALGYTPYNAASIGGASVAYAGQVAAKNTGKALSDINAVASSADLWNDRGNSWVFENYNNALAVTVGGTQNDRNANIQVGHSAAAYGQITGALYLNKLGGEVYIGSGLAIHSGNYTAYCATAAQGAKADTAASALSAHIGNTSNPHSVTKAQVGLGNVDNTADSVKSVAYAANAGQLGGIAAANYYHSGNSNKSDVAWACSTLTASGNITGALLKSTTNGNTVTIGSQNASFCHIYNSADVPFIFNKDIQTTGGLLPYGSGTHDLGNSSHRWGDAYVNGINASGNATIAGSLSMGDTLDMSGNEVLAAATSVLYVNRGLQTRTVDFFGTNIRFRNSGNIGIGTTSPSQKLHVVGNIIATGALTAGAASDARLKDNIRNLANAVTVLKSLRPVSFDWNATATGHYSALKGHDVGLVAQEVEPYIPSAVGTIFGDYKRLDYTKVTPYLIAGWQDHESRIATLERENAELKRRLNIN